VINRNTLIGVSLNEHFIDNITFDISPVSHHEAIIQFGAMLAFDQRQCPKYAYSMTSTPTRDARKILCRNVKRKSLD
jgi:hypothetical protein